MGFASLLHIPSQVRLLILKFAGVPTDTEIYLNGSCDMLKGRNHRPKPPPLSSTYALLLTSQLLYNEVSTILFTTNLILLKPAEPLDLRLLSRLRPGTLKLFRRLTIHLNSTGGLPHNPCDQGLPITSKPYSGTYASRPLSLRPEDETLVHEWQTAMVYVLSQIEPFTLSLHIVCDCKDLKTAEWITRPLWDSQNALADCAIRLSQKRVEALRDEAVRTAHHAMRKQVTPCIPFSFMKLPSEIRQLILEFTDLVTPLNEIEWAPRVGYQYYHNWNYCWPECKWYCGKFHYACRYFDCWKSQQDGCFCRRYHSSYSSKCHCWLYPTPMLLVSHAFKREADRILYSTNRFVVRSKRGFQTAAKYTPPRIAPTIFFNLLNDNLRHLKHLELVFPPVDYDYLRTRDPAYPKWVDSIVFAADRLTLSRLTLSVVMADHLLLGTNITHFRYHMTASQGNTIIEMYFRIIQPLQRLKDAGLTKFFVTLAWPWHWTEGGKRRRNIEKERVNQEVADLEHRVEQAVMGDHYNGISMGKHDIRRSHWVDRYWEGWNMGMPPVDNSESENDLDE